MEHFDLWAIGIFRNGTKHGLFYGIKRIVNLYN